MTRVACRGSADGSRGRAGVSSFGISGTNAHVILEEARGVEHAHALQGEPGADGVPGQATSEVSPFLLSASSVEALAGQAQRLRSFVEGEPELDLHGVGGALALRRASLPHRAIVLAGDRKELLTGLDALERGGSADGLVSGKLGGGGGRLAFLFSGQGSQWAGMGRELYEAFPVFAGELDALCGELDGLLNCSSRDLLFAEEGSDDAARLEQTEYTQPALFALEVALYRLVSSFGLKPALLMGHSIGELSAAYVAGVFSLDDACRLVVSRGRLMGALEGVGAMAAVRASEKEVLEGLNGFADRLALAAVNAPEAVVVSGDEVARVNGSEFCSGRGWAERKITRLASQSRFPFGADGSDVGGVRRRWRSGVSFAEPQIPIVSNVTG